LLHPFIFRLTGCLLYSVNINDERLADRGNHQEERRAEQIQKNLRFPHRFEEDRPNGIGNEKKSCHCKQGDELAIDGKFGGNKGG